MGFWANVEQEREFQGLSRKELAFRAHIAYQGIGLGLERNSMPGVDTAVKIAKVLDVPVEYLLDKTDADIQPQDAKKLSDTALNLYKKNQTVIDSLEKLPVHIKEPIIQMITRLASNIDT